jgi:hypothetical protein
VACADDHLEHLVEGVVDVDGADADARHHHLVDLLVPELDDPVDHLLLLLLDAPLLRAVSTSSFSSSVDR